MNKEVILMSDVDGLGIVGDVVKVSPGYARNYLIPRKLGAPVSALMIQRLAQKRATREVELQDELQKAEAMSEKFKDASCTIPVKTSGEGSLYGAVHVAEIVEAAGKQGIKLNKEQVILDAPLKELGMFNVAIRLHPKVKASIKVWIVEE